MGHLFTMDENMDGRTDQWRLSARTHENETLKVFDFLVSVEADVCGSSLVCSTLCAITLLMMITHSLLELLHHCQW